MLTKKHKLLGLKTKKLVNNLYLWNYKTNLKWKWIEFVDFRDYSYWDDVKNIDFLRSEKEGKTLIKLFEEERELSVYFVIDYNDSYEEKYFWEKTKYDILLEIMYLIWLSAIKSWDKVWTVFWFKKYNFFHAKKWKQNFINIINSLETEITSEKISFIWKYMNLFSKTLKSKRLIDNLWYFNKLKVKNSLVFYITDKVDIDLKDIKIAVTKNDLILCNIFNSFENNLEWKWMVWIKDLDIKLDLWDSEKIKNYKNKRLTLIEKQKKEVTKFSWKYLYFDENIDSYKQFYKLFKK